MMGEVVQKGLRKALALLLGCALFGSIASGCTPRVEVASPEKPITINLNVKIDHEVRVKVDRELDAVISEESELF